MGKIARYLEERAKWKHFGKPIRSDEEIAELFTICEGCPNFQRQNANAGECGVCGCGLKKIGHWLNKLAWGTTHCPLPEPKWEESKPKYKQARTMGVSEGELRAAERDYNVEAKNNFEASQKKQPCGCGKR